MSTQELSSPLHSIIRKAASNQVEGPAAKMKRRIADAQGGVFVLIDCSGSMLDTIGSSRMSKFEHMQIALRDVLIGYPKIRIIAFGTTAVEVPNPKDLACNGGGTNLAGGLEFVSKFKPHKTIVISDGLPDSEEDAMDAADKMTGSVDCIYCGPDAHPAVKWLQSLAKSCGGVQATWDGYKPLGQTIRGLLPAPGDAAIQL